MAIASRTARTLERRYRDVVTVACFSASGRSSRCRMSIRLCECDDRVLRTAVRPELAAVVAQAPRAERNRRQLVDFGVLLAGVEAEQPVVVELAALRRDEVEAPGHDDHSGDLTRNRDRSQNGPGFVEFEDHLVVALAQIEPVAVVGEERAGVIRAGDLFTLEVLAHDVAADPAVVAVVAQDDAQGVARHRQAVWLAGCDHLFEDSPLLGREAVDAIRFVGADPEIRAVARESHRGGTRGGDADQLFDDRERLIHVRRPFPPKGTGSRLRTANRRAGWPSSAS